MHSARARPLRTTLLAPSLLLVGLAAFALLANRDRLGLDLAGGRILPVGDLQETWRAYAAAWHPVAGGTGAQAPAALAVLGVLGAPFWLVGGPAAAVSLLLIADAPLAGLAAYHATRRMGAPRWVRALAAAGYAVLPPATAAVAQGRIDAVAVHLLAPLVLLGLSNLLMPPERIAGRAAWLPGASLCALGLAALGAFSPLVYLLLVLLALVGFVALPAPEGAGGARAGALFVIVLLPLALLLPWPAVLLQHPAVVLQGIGATVGDQPTAVGNLVTLDPGGAGAWPFIGVLVLFAGLLAVVLRPRRALLPGLLAALVGAIGVLLVALLPLAPVGGGAPRHGWAGAPLLLVGAGVLAVVVQACTDGAVPAAPLNRSTKAVLAGAGAVVLAALVLSGVTAGAFGAVHPGGGVRLAAAERAQLATSRSAVLVLGTAGEPTRRRAGAAPMFGDDDLPRGSGVSDRLEGWAQQLRTGDRGTVRSVLGQAAAAGVAYVVTPGQGVATRVSLFAGDLVQSVTPSSNSRPVLRLRQASPGVALIAPSLARLAVTGGEPPTPAEPGSVTRVPSSPPSIAVRVDDGSRGRLLVAAAEYEPGWQATVNGRDTPLTRAWSHQVSVSVPAGGADVRIFYSSTVRTVLLLFEGAALLFALLTAIPGRRSAPARRR